MVDEQLVAVTVRIITEAGVYLIMIPNALVAEGAVYSTVKAWKETYVGIVLLAEVIDVETSMTGVTAASVANLGATTAMTGATAASVVLRETLTTGPELTDLETEGVAEGSKNVSTIAFAPTAMYGAHRWTFINETKITKTTIHFRKIPFPKTPLVRIPLP